MFAILVLMFCLVVMYVAFVVMAKELATKLDKAEAELMILQAELAKYRKHRDSRGRFTK